jgi:hypothetical protein
MPKRKGLIEEFWENVKLPYVRHQAVRELFDGLNEFMNPKTYAGDGILTSVVKLFKDLLK